MASALNVFKTVTAELTTSPATLYTAPTGYTVGSTTTGTTPVCDTGYTATGALGTISCSAASAGTWTVSGSATCAGESS